MPKKVIKIKIKKIEHPHWILHIRISLGTEFQYKQTFLIFWAKFAQKGYFQSKQIKWTTPLNSTYSN